VTYDRSDDVPSPIDLRKVDDAREWAASATHKRPWRAQFFEQFVTELRTMNRAPLRILELGSGPGFLAYHILQAIPVVDYTMLDFSPAMHELARERLGLLMRHVRPVLADMRADDSVNSTPLSPTKPFTNSGTRSTRWRCIKPSDRC
jgi:SAM-dependent methyltransferase